MATADSTTPDKAAAERRDAVLRETYAEATKQLREAHLSEFNTLRQQLAAAQGVEWTPAPTKQEQAASQIAALLAEFPDLVSQIPGVTA